MASPTNGQLSADVANAAPPTFVGGGPYTPRLSSDEVTNGQVIELEIRATAEFTRDASAEVIRKLYSYVEPNIEQFGQLEECVPFIQRAADAYAAEDYNSALSLAYEGYRSLIAIRALVPGLQPR